MAQCKTCPTCQGEGKIISEYSLPPFPVCGDCGGTGNVPVSVEITTGGERIIGAGDDYPVINQTHFDSGEGTKIYTSEYLTSTEDSYKAAIYAKDEEIAQLKGAKKFYISVVEEWSKVFDLVNDISPAMVGANKAQHVFNYIKSTIK